MSIAVIYEGARGIRVDHPSITIHGAPHEELIETARERVDAGASRIELCGGLGAEDAAAVAAAVGDRAEVRLNRYGFESLELVTQYKQAFVTGDAGPAAFMYFAPDSDPQADRIEHPDGSFIPVPDDAAVEGVARALAYDGVAILELYGGLGVPAAAAAFRGSRGTIAVGFVDAD